MSHTSDLWAIEELGERVAGALAGAGYAGVPSGRVRDVPDPRTIRYYTTLGLLDRPAGSRGRTALYGPRHLLQLAAIKRLQAAGRTLAEIQAEVAGATDAALARAAGLGPLPEAPAAPRAAGPRPAPRPSPSPAAGRAAFWREAPAPPKPQPPPDAAAVPLQAVRVGDDATLLLAARRPLGDDDLRVIALAAAPLIELLTLRGLIGQGAAGHERDGPTETTPRPRPEEAAR
jgi:hypothetical protein